MLCLKIPELSPIVSKLVQNEAYEIAFRRGGFSGDLKGNGLLSLKRWLVVKANFAIFSECYVLSILESCSITHMNLQFILSIYIHKFFR